MSLKTRSITGLVFGVVMIAGTLAHPLSSAALYALVGLLCLWEFYNLVLTEDSSATWNIARRILGLSIALGPAFSVANAAYGIWPLAQDYAAYLLPLFLLPLLLELFAASSKPFQNAAFLFLGLVYIGIPTALLENFSLHAESGRFLIMSVMLLIWTNDVFAYLVGSKIGKTKLIPRVSPGKTWEGIAGGWLGTLLLAYFYNQIFPQVPLSPFQWMVLGVCCALFGMLGDLVESILKRSLGIKDSGNILPGHGGFLDRFDAFIFAFPFAAFLILVVFKKTEYLTWLF